jgi:hypothetical protein
MMLSAVRKLSSKRPSIRGSTTPFPDYDTEPVVAFSAT